MKNSAEHNLRVAFDNQAFTMQQFGGVSRYCYRLAKQLNDMSDVDARIFAPLHINQYLQQDQEICKGVALKEMPNTGRILRELNHCLSWWPMQRFRPDIVHETYYQPWQRGPASAARVVTVYDMIHERYQKNFRAGDPTIAWKKQAVARADHVICISMNTKQDLLDIYRLDEAKVSVVYLGFDRLGSSKDIAEKAEGEPFLLYVGARWAHKNFKRFIEAFASSPWLRTNFRIVCFGGGAFNKEEQALFAELNIGEDKVIQFDGGDERLAFFYRNALAFVYPSIYEGFGIPPLEAMSEGCPVICSDSSSIPEVVGDAAQYFDPNSTDDMRTALERILQSDSLRNDMALRGQKRVEQFSWEKCASETRSIYDTLVGAN